MADVNSASTEFDFQLKPQMSFALLPKEIRLQIWGLVYFAQPPRLVALRTKPHDEHHEYDVFCPRYSPSPAPTIVNVCHEARAEAWYLAKKAGHLVSLPVGLIMDRTPQVTEQFYFRFETDILYLPFDDAYARHHDELPENGFLAHFAYASGCDTKALRNIAVTKVVWSGYHDGSFSNALRDYPNISHMIMTVPLEARDDPVKRTTFVRAARRITALYKWDQYNLSAIPREVQVDVDFATINKSKMDIISKGKWKDWSELGSDWVSNETGRHFFASAFSS